MHCRTRKKSAELGARDGPSQRGADFQFTVSQGFQPAAQDESKASRTGDTLPIDNRRYVVSTLSLSLPFTVGGESFPINRYCPCRCFGQSLLLGLELSEPEKCGRR
jgi:hypothetical protein